jgi:hypothetical protein
MRGALSGARTLIKAPPNPRRPTRVYRSRQADRRSPAKAAGTTSKWAGVLPTGSASACTGSGRPRRLATRTERARSAQSVTVLSVPDQAAERLERGFLDRHGSGRGEDARVLADEAQPLKADALEIEIKGCLVSRLDQFDELPVRGTRQTLQHTLARDWWNHRVIA